eukprot:IDg15442t1
MSGFALEAHLRAGGSNRRRSIHVSGTEPQRTTRLNQQLSQRRRTFSLPEESERRSRRLRRSHIDCILPLRLILQSMYLRRSRRKHSKSTPSIAAAT